MSKRARELHGDALLSHAELEDLTGKIKNSAIKKALEKMNVRFLVRPDGSLVVARSLVNTLLARYQERPPAPPERPPVDLSVFGARQRRRINSGG